MRISVFLFLVLFLASCSEKNETVKKLSAADSLVIHFNTPQSNTIEKSINTTEKKAIKKMAGFMNGKSAPEYKCGYDGNMLFYKNGDLTGDVSFNFSGSGCSHFMQLENGKLTSTAMSNEAIDFLKSLYEGKNWY